MTKHHHRAVWPSLDEIERMEETSEFIARNLDEVGQARSAANVRTKAQAEAMRKRNGFDQDTPDYFFKVGDMVKLKHHERLKLEFKWKGPYHVVDVGHPGTYWLMTPQGLRFPNAINQSDLAPWLAPVIDNKLVRSQRWFWSRRTKQLYKNRYWLTPQVRPKTVKQRHSFALMETLRTCGDSASLQKYVTRQFLDTFGFFKDPSFDQSRAHGTRYLVLARMDALWTARKAIQIGILVDTHPFSVDHCILCDQQLLSTSIAHLVVECEQVTGHRIQSGLVPAIQKSRLRLLGRSTRSKCGDVYTWLRGGVINGKAESGPAVVGRDCGA
ncbi:hypothetical protein BASA83_004623 [Batrachochytrium salamandrivorans]|nr:hypothetical protein BASA83_004623 [Batrachochytrium salamandrivorans]